LFVVVSMGLRFELRDLPSWGRCCTAWATPSVHFALVILEMEGVSRTICWGWSRTLIFQISASQVARISSQAWAAGTWPFCFYFVFETGSFNFCWTGLASSSQAAGIIGCVATSGFHCSLFVLWCLGILDQWFPFAYVYCSSSSKRSERVVVW
jgi:hypothetical protein